MKHNIGIIGALGISAWGLSGCAAAVDEQRGEQSSQQSGETGSHHSALEERASTVDECAAGTVCEDTTAAPEDETQPRKPSIEPDEIDVWDEQDPSFGGGRVSDDSERPEPSIEPDEIDVAQAFQGDVPLLNILFQKFVSLQAQSLGARFVKAYQAAQGGAGNGGIAQGNGKLKEIEVAHIGGTGSTSSPILVTAAGTGSVGVLSSFRASDPAAAPVHLSDSPKLLGYNHQLRVLRADDESKSSYRLLLSARVSNDKLWLTSWRVGADGAFQHLDTLGYGRSAGVDVDSYTLAHRAITNDAYLVVSPITHGDQVRLITWNVNGTTGKITGRFQSGDAPGAIEPGSDLTASLNAGNSVVLPHFVVAYQTTNSRLAQTLWSVTNAGEPFLLSSANSGRDIRNNNGLSTNIEALAQAPINDTGHVTASTWNGDLRMMVWEDSDCADTTCQFGPLVISTENNDLNPDIRGVQQDPAVSPQPNTQRVMVRDPIANVDRFTRNPDTVQAIASVRKVMATIVALDAVRDGKASLDDLVTVSAAAANVNSTGASAMGLQAGEQISLRDLLYGNMMVSAGDATWAISEHIAGSIDNMVTRMNVKAISLGLDNTFHCQRGSTFSAVSYSTARDQAALWESVFDDELFLEFAGEESRLVCGTVNDSQVCHPVPQAQPMLNNSMFNYPNIAGYKTGGGGGKCQDLQQYANTPSCPTGGCMSVQTTRIGRPLIVTELQPESLSGFRWSDSYNLQDWSFRQIFTPDLRGDSDVQAGSTADFGIDGVTDLHAVSASLTAGASFKICNWATDPEGGAVDQSTCTSYLLPGLAASPRVLPVTRLKMVQVSSLYADADYLLGQLDGDELRLQLWRVGQRE